MISLFSKNSIFLLPGDAWRIDHQRKVRRVDQKLTRSDGPAAAYSGRHDCNLSRLAIEDARHDAIVAVVVGGLLLRPINEPIVTIGACASANFLDHGQNSFGTHTLSRQTVR